MTVPTPHRDGVERWRVQARGMVDALVAAGQLSSPNAKEAMSTVPRHLFAPDVPATEAYADAVLTQTRPVGDQDGQHWPTSSLSAPAAVAVPLERLELIGRERVLEIGTGTGYVAALLSTLLGAQNVYSIDIDPELVTAAATRLAQLDLAPTLLARDGYHGLAEHGPYDRILATCSITHVPPEWIRQLVPGGRIVAPLDGDRDTPYLVLDKTAPDEVTGRFDREGGGFMPLRPTLASPLGPRDTAEVTGPRSIAHYGTTALGPDRLTHRSPALAMFCRLHLPGLRLPLRPEPGQAAAQEMFVHQGDSDARISRIPGPDGQWTVIQAGPRRIWDTIETAVTAWDLLDHPTLDRFGISALDNPHRQYVWLDDPTGPYAWPLPAT
ncbi:MAG: methyltransferase domain-containing protein [Pseudonocardia sp.]